MVERQSDYKIKTLKIDGGGEYVLNDFGKFCDQEGIVHDVVPPQTPQQNKVAERKNRFFMDMVRSMMKGKNLPKELWGEEVSTTACLLNRCQIKKLKIITSKNHGLNSSQI